METLKTNSLDCAGDAIIGDREEQQDAFWFAPWPTAPVSRNNALVICLSDGMGGHVGGAAAARAAVNAGLTSFLDAGGEIPARLEKACHAANQAVADARDELAGGEDMGCTFLLAAIAGNVAWFASIGDSVLFQWRGGAMRRVNEDHSMMPVLQQMVKDGELSEEAAASDPRRSQLRSAMTGDELRLIDITQQPIQLGKKDVLVMASDGLLALEAEYVSGVLEKSGKPAKAVQNMLSSVRKVQNQHLDNTTIVLCRYRGKGLFR